MLDWYQQRLQDGTLLPDSAQQRAAQCLNEFGALLAAETQQPKWEKSLRRWFNGKRTNGGGNSDSTRGVYLHGSVGRGKTLLMDGFYLHLSLARKLRVHFHQFMRRLHQDMKAHEDKPDPLAHVAGKISEQFDLICFDEFHVSNITDAMLLGRLLEQLLGAGVCFVMTSNYPPAALYPNGLARDRFLPTIALIEKNLRVVALDGDEDYRRRLLADQPVYFSPWQDAAVQENMRKAFDNLAGGITLQNNIKLGGRRVPALARASDCIWFSFAELCEQPRGKEDYLQLAERFATVFLSDVPRLDDDDIADAAKRFTWLIDILYDTHTRLVLGAATALDDLYGTREGGESGRTLSRLLAMQSATYGSGSAAATETTAASA